MVTIKDIAEMAGVSKGAVSRYLNGTLKVKEETAKRIEDAIKETNFTRNYNAASIKTKKSNTIAMVYPSMTSLISGHVAETVNNILSEKGYLMTTYTTNNDLEKEKEAVVKMREQRVAGAIFFTEPHGDGDESHLRLLEEVGIKVVVIDRYVLPSGFSSVITDYATGVAKVMDSLIAAGHKRIGLILGWPGQNKGEAAIKAYKQSLKDAGLEFDDTLLAYSYYEQEPRIRANEKLFEANVDAIFALSEKVALKSIELINEKGLSIPEDIAVVSSGNTEYSALAKLTALDLKTELLAEEAAKMLLAKINGEEAEEFILVEPSVVYRDTTKTRS